MIIGVPTEVKNNEFRVAMTPAGAHALAQRHQELLELLHVGRDVFIFFVEIP